MNKMEDLLPIVVISFHKLKLKFDSVNDSLILTTVNGKIDLTKPRVMAILNITPDSFYDGGSIQDVSWADKKAELMLNDGADIIDLGAVSTRPGSGEVSMDMEKKRLFPVLESIIKHFPKAILSVDTYRSEVAKESIEMGAHIINDISGGKHDSKMFPLIAKMKVPYILMHMQGSPQDMQNNPQYVNVVDEVRQFFSAQLNKFAALGVNTNVVIDPGFGFGKTVEHNFQLLKGMKVLKSLGFPILAGVSRKSMINRILGTKPEDALNGTSVVNTLALMNGANILRVHDVKEACQAIELSNYYNSI